jgi:hypothetical protein
VSRLVGAEVESLELAETEASVEAEVQQMGLVQVVR